VPKKSLVESLPRRKVVALQARRDRKRR